MATMPNPTTSRPSSGRVQDLAGTRPTGSLNLEDIIHYQASRGILGWNVWYQPLAFLIFFIAAMAETNRLPFDLPECEQELIGGYHTGGNTPQVSYSAYFGAATRALYRAAITGAPPAGPTS